MNKFLLTNLSLLTFIFVMVACTKPAPEVSKAPKFKVPTQVLLKNGCTVQINKPPYLLDAESSKPEYEYVIAGVYSVGNCPQENRPQKGYSVKESDIESQAK